MTRQMFLQMLIDLKHYTRYLEIGAQKGKTFNLIRCPVKVGVDPVRGAATFVGTSDQFFAQNAARYDLIFVDGLHQHEQVLTDVAHAMEVLEPRGLIVLHDCNPILERRQTHDSPGHGGWNGDVWKAFVTLRQRHDLDCACGNFDQGMGVVVRRPNSKPLPLPHVLSWQTLEQNRQEWLRLMPPAALLEWIG